MILSLLNVTGEWPLPGAGTYEDTVLGKPVTYTVQANQSCFVHVLVNMGAGSVPAVTSTVTHTMTRTPMVRYESTLTWPSPVFPFPLMVYCTGLFCLLAWLLRRMSRFTLELDAVKPRQLTLLANIVGMGAHAWVVMFMWGIDLFFTTDFDRRRADHVWTVYACTAAVAGYTCARVKCYHASHVLVRLVSCEDMVSLWFLPGALFLLWQNEEVPWEERVFSTGLWVGIGIPSFWIAQRLGHTLHGRHGDRLYTLSRVPHRCLLFLSVAPTVLGAYQWPFLVSMWFQIGNNLFLETLCALFLLTLSAVACAWANVYAGYTNGRFAWPWRSVTSTSSIFLYLWVGMLATYERHGWADILPRTEYYATITAGSLLGSLMLGCVGWSCSRLVVDRWHQESKFE